jgi:hypothetical protein
MGSWVVPTWLFVYISIGSSRTYDLVVYMSPHQSIVPSKVGTLRTISQELGRNVLRSHTLALLSISALVVEYHPEPQT